MGSGTDWSKVVWATEGAKRNTDFSIPRPLYKYVYNPPRPANPFRFAGDALESLRGFPDDARRRAGLQLHRLQHGKSPDDWRPMPSIGKGVAEIRIRTAAGSFRVIHVTGIEHAICVLHCFSKKSGRTARPDVEIARRRFAEAARDRR